MIMNDEILNQIENIVASNAESPDKLSIELEALKSSYSIQDIREALNGESLFGDPKLSGIIRDYYSASKKPLDNAYIKSLDFCENEVCEAIKDVEKLTYVEDIFRTTMMEPIFLTDSGTLKHELVKDFEFPKILLTGDEILQSNDIAELCSPTVISMIAHSKDKDYTEDMTMKELLEYVTEIKSFSESALGQILTNSGDFNLMSRIKSTRGVQYLSKLLRRRSRQANDKNSKFKKPKNMSRDTPVVGNDPKIEPGDFEDEKGNIKGSVGVSVLGSNMPKKIEMGEVKDIPKGPATNPSPRYLDSSGSSVGRNLHGKK